MGKLALPMGGEPDQVLAIRAIAMNKDDQAISRATITGPKARAVKKAGGRLGHGLLDIIKGRFYRHSDP
jgi:hypothetical protein